MFGGLKQIFAVTALNLRTIQARLGSSAVGVVGIAGVVVVLVSVLSIAAGFAAAMRGNGSDARAIVMRSGADAEMSSILTGPEMELIKQAPGIVREGQTPLASAELATISSTSASASSRWSAPSRRSTTTPSPTSEGSPRASRRSGRIPAPTNRSASLEPS